MTTWDEVWAEHQRNIGFREGPGNRNPWTSEMGAGNAAYCIAAATIIPHHHGVQWWADAQFGVKGYAYCPYGRVGAERHGVWQFDHASTGQPCDLLPGDILLFDWNNDGVADHAETVVAVYADWTYDTIGYNTGSPEGCYFPVRRNRKYLLGRIRMHGTFYTAAPIPVPVPGPGGNVQTNFAVPGFTILGNVASVWFPPTGGMYLLTDQGFVYAFGGAVYKGGPGADEAATHWKAGHRIGKSIGPPTDKDGNPVPGFYTVRDTANEVYTY